MALNTSSIFKKGLFLNTSSLSDGERLDLWKTRTKIFLEANDFDLSNFIIKGSFIHTYYTNNKVVNTPDNLWTEYVKRKVKLGFKVKHLLMSSLSTKELYFVFNCNSTKEIWNTLEIIHEDFLRLRNRE